MSKCESARTYYHYELDSLESITHVVGGCEVLDRYGYDAWGNLTECEEKVKNRFRFCGEMQDPISRQYYLRARYYNPVIGRFIQEDTYRGDGLNLYAYCANSPVNYVDPSGHCGEKKGNPFADEVAGHVALEQEFAKKHGTGVYYDDGKSKDINDNNSQRNQPEKPSTDVPDSQGRKQSNNNEDGSDSFGIVNGKTPASRFADKLRGLSNAKRPNTVAVIRTADGKYYAGYNKAGIYNHNIQKVLDYLGNRNLYGRQCAEVNAISRAFNDGVDLKGATISVANVRKANDTSGIHGTHKPPCDVCQPLIDFFKIKVIG